MHILFTRFPLESRLGGAEVQTVSLMRGFIERGHEVRFLGSCPMLIKFCRANGIPYVELSIGVPPVTKWGAVSLLWRRFGMRRKLEEAFERFKDCSAVCMLSLSEKLLLTPMAVESGARVLWIEHDTVGRWLRKNPWLPRLIQLSSKVTTVGVSKLSRDLYVEMGWDPSCVIAIPNGIEIERLKNNGECNPESACPEPRRRVEGFHAGTVARLSPEKGLDLLIEAVATLPDVHLTIVGTGPQEKRLRSMIFSLQWGDRVTIEPHIEDLQSFYRSLDAFILSSRAHDPFGLAAAEAMACGIATVVTDQCGIAGELTDHENALIVQAGSASALGKAVAQLQSSDQLRRQLAEAGMQKVKDDLTVDRMVERYEDFLTES